MNGVGTVSTSVHAADGATVFVVTGIGLWLRTRTDDAGLSFGWSRQVYVFPGAVPAGVWPTAGIAHDSRTAGLSIDATTGLSITFGLAGRTVLAKADPGQARTYRLRYDAAAPAATCFRDIAQGSDTEGRGACP